MIIRAKDVDHAVQIANDNEAGLSASVWTRDYKEALEVAKRIESGAVSWSGKLGSSQTDPPMVQVHINGSSVHDEPNLPHGGMKVKDIF